jgi:hypothetical protein
MAEFSASVRGERRSGYFNRYGEDATFVQVIRDSADYNPKTGALNDTTANTALTKVCQSDVTLKQIKNSGGNLKAGDKWFRFTLSQLPAGSPTKLDRMIFQSATYQVVDWTFSADRTVIEVAGRKI